MSTAQRGSAVIGEAHDRDPPADRLSPVPRAWRLLLHCYAGFVPVLSNRTPKARHESDHSAGFQDVRSTDRIVAGQIGALSLPNNSPSIFHLHSRLRLHQRLRFGAVIGGYGDRGVAVSAVQKVQAPDIHACLLELLRQPGQRTRLVAQSQD